MPDSRLEQIKELYTKWLNREADTSGARHYCDSSLSIEQIEATLKGSPERFAIEKRERAGGAEFDVVEPRLLVGSAFETRAISALLKARVTHVLEIHKTEEDHSGSFKGHLCLGLPANTVMSVSDMEKALLFIQDFMNDGNEKGKLLVVGMQGLSAAPAVAAMWYIANGMDETPAASYVESRREGSSVRDALLGPWHYEAAAGLFKD